MTNMQKILKLSFLAIVLVASLSLINTSSVKALTIADQNGIPSACPAKAPNNTAACTVFINSITVNGFNDNDTSPTARITPVPYGYLIPGQTINISWTDNSGSNVNNYIVKYGCGDNVDLANDDYTISYPVWPKSTTWTVPSTNYKYCKLWVYAKGAPNQVYYQLGPTLGVSNTRVFETQPPVTRYSCNSNYQCVVDTNGAYTSLTSCQNNCVAPAVRYSCNTNTYQCYQAVFGTYATYNDCVNACQPPVTRYSCNSNYQCVVDPNGSYTSLTSCQNNCVAPAVRYSCNTNTYQCYQAVFGTYASYNDCANACQPPVTRYSCNSNYQCVVDTNGAYTSLTSCQNNCVAPAVRYSCNTNTYQCYQAVFGTYASYNDCVNACQPNIQPLTVSCYASPNNPQVNQVVTFYSNVNGGNGIYNYYWSGYASGNSSYIQQTFNSAGTYTAYLTVTDSNGRTGSTSCSAYVQGQTVITPTLSFWADKYNLNQGETTYLRWTSNNASYCVASNGWSGTKSTSNYESTTPNNQTTYTLTCYGNGGQITQSVTLYTIAPSTNLSFTKLGRNLSNGDRAYSKVIRVAQGDVVEFYLTVTAGSSNDLQNVVVTDPLPDAFSYKAGTTKVNDVIQADTITTTGLSLGTIYRGTSKTILFQAISNNPGTILTYTNTAQVTASGISSLTDSATITYGLVAGASTVATGAEDSLIISLIISLGLALLIWYYLKFNPQGKLAFAKLENKIRDVRLEYTKKQLLKK